MFFQHFFLLMEVFYLELVKTIFSVLFRYSYMHTHTHTRSQYSLPRILRTRISLSRSVGCLHLGVKGGTAARAHVDERRRRRCVIKAAGGELAATAMMSSASFSSAAACGGLS